MFDTTGCYKLIYGYCRIESNDMNIVDGIISIIFEYQRHAQWSKRYYGPCSATTDLHVARSFAGKDGMIIVMKPDTSRTQYKVLDISWISDYPDEREYLMFDHKIDIDTWVSSSDYDQNYHYYHSTLTKDTTVTIDDTKESKEAEILDLMTD